MSSLLGRWGYQVFKATEPEQALEIIQKENIQVWLIDQHLNHNQLGVDFITQNRQEDVPCCLNYSGLAPRVTAAIKRTEYCFTQKAVKTSFIKSMVIWA